MIPVHPIEVESYRILAERVDLERWPPLSRAVVARVIHASADVGYADALVVDGGACAAGPAARSRVRRCRDGGSGPDADAPSTAGRLLAPERGFSASARGTRWAAERWPARAIVEAVA